MPPLIWDAAAGMGLVAAVRRAGGAVPAALEPPSWAGTQAEAVAATDRQQAEADAAALDALRALAESVGEVFGTADAAAHVTKRPQARNRADALGKALGHLEKARALLDDDALLALVERHPQAMSDGSPIDVLPMLDAMIAVLAGARTGKQVPDAALLPDDGITPQARQVRGLAAIYRSSFDAPLSDPRPAGRKAWTPAFMAFVTEAYTLAGHPWQSQEALKKALSTHLR